MRLLRAIVGCLLALSGGHSMAVPELQYSVSSPDSVAGTGNGRHAWELRDTLNRFFNYRIAASDESAFRYKDEELIVHNLSSDGRSFSAFIDWHPFAGRLRFSTGAVLHTQFFDYAVAPVIDDFFEFQIQYDLQSITDELLAQGVSMEELEFHLPDDEAAGTVNVSQHITLEPTDLAGHARIRYRRVVPYFGIGWANAAYAQNRLRYSFDLGLLYRGKPDIDVTLDGRVMSQPEVAAPLNVWMLEQELKLHKKLDKQAIAPRLNFGLSYAFE
ncbi:MAG TPA: hypothetical protein VGL10_09725 [Gammaproteobacteria bacterium]